MTIELVTFSTLADYLELSQSAIDDYPALGVIRDSVTAAIEAYIGRELEQIERTHAEYSFDRPMRMIGLKGLPVVSVTSVQEGPTHANLANVDYRETHYGIELAAVSRNGKIVVVYTGGYLAADVPPQISRAALIQTAYEFQSKEHIGAETVSTEGGTVTRPAIQLLKEVRRMLDTFKHPLMVA